MRPPTLCTAGIVSNHSSSSVSPLLSWAALERGSERCGRRPSIRVNLLQVVAQHLSDK